MAREFGKRSYNPEKIYFSAMGNQPSGLPWRAVGRALPNNILLEASNHPSTAEELAIELGVALPYMEEEINLLEKATLLKRQEEKGATRYLTNFIILDREIKTDIRALQLEGSAKRGELMHAMLTDIEARLLSLGLYRDETQVDSQRWLWVMLMCDSLISRCQKRIGFEENTPRPDGGAWDFIGHEENGLPDLSSWHNGAGKGDTVWAYSIPKYQPKIEKYRTDFSAEHTALLADILKNHRVASSLSQSEQDLLGQYPYTHIDKETDTIVFDIAVLNDADIQAIDDALLTHPHAALLEQALDKLAAETQQKLAHITHPAVHDQLKVGVGFTLYDLRVMMTDTLLDLGYLTLPADPARDLFMIYLYLRIK